MKIILFGKKRDQELSDFLLKQLSKKYKFNYYTGDNEITSSLLKIYEIDKMHFADDEDCIIILKSKAKLSNIKLGKNTTILISSDNSKQLKGIAEYNYPVIACGMSNKDTITFSSLSGENSVISVQRSLVICGKSIDPLEIPAIHDTEYNLYGILCYTAIALALEADYENISFNFK